MNRLLTEDCLFQRNRSFFMAPEFRYICAKSIENDTNVF